MDTRHDASSTPPATLDAADSPSGISANPTIPAASSAASVWNDDSEKRNNSQEMTQDTRLVNPTKAAFLRKAGNSFPGRQGNSNDGLGALSDRATATMQNTPRHKVEDKCTSGCGTSANASPFFRKALGRKVVKKIQPLVSLERPGAQHKGAITAQSNPFFNKNRDRKLASLKEWRLKHATAMQSAASPPVIRRIPGFAATMEDNPFFIRDSSRKVARAVESRLSSLSQSLSEMASEYCNLKLASDEAPISEFCLVNRTLAYEIYNLRANDLERSLYHMASNLWEKILRPRLSTRRNLEQLTSQLLLKNRTLAYDIYDIWGDRLGRSLCHLECYSWDRFIGPRLSAKRKIDQLLNHYNEKEEAYSHLKYLSTKWSNSFRDLRVTVRYLAREKDLAMHPDRREYWLSQDHLLSIFHSNVQRAIHGYRACYREKLLFTGPYADLWQVKKQLIKPTREVDSPKPSDVINTLFDACESGDKLESYPNIFPNVFGPVYRNFYLPLMSIPETSRDPTQDMHLRQLDALAPFDIVLQSGLTIEHELQYLVKTLDDRIGLWAWLDAHSLGHHRFNLKNAGHAFRANRGELAALYTDFAHVNWIRLKIDRKLRDMEVSDLSNEYRSFAILNPISKDITCFNQWVDAICGERIQQRIAISGERLQWSNRALSWRSVIRVPASPIQKPVGIVKPEDVPTVHYMKRPSSGMVTGQGSSRPTTTALAAGWQRATHMLPSTRRPYSWESTATNEAATRQQFQTRQDSPAKASAMPKYWSHRLHKGPDGKGIVVHYCRNLSSTEEVARHFLDDEVIGFDLEWKIQASNDIQSNLSLIQIANEKRIALFHIALFKPATGLHDFVAPSLRQILESPNITKVGVSIKADCTRLRKYLGINSRGIFELSHLHKLVKYCQSNPKLINKRLVNLSEQVEEHFGLPLMKDGEVRCSNWSRPLNYDQVQYAAADPFACICLFNTMDQKRQSMDPVPPRPAHAELDLPIRIGEEEEETVTELMVKRKTRKVVEIPESPTADATVDGKSS